MNVIRIFQTWNLHLIQTYGINKVDWMDQQMVNEDKWDEFRVSGYDPNNPRLSQGSTTALPIPYPALSALVTCKAVEECHRRFQEGQQEGQIPL